MISVAQFRIDFPEFASLPKYPQTQISLYLNLAGIQLDTSRWGPSAADPWPTVNPPQKTIYDFGVEFFVAHHLALWARRMADANNGGIPGTATGPVNSKSVDKVSVGYDTGAAAEEKGGHWNLTNYGQEFLRMAKQMGAGMLQLNVGCDPAGPLDGPAWYGPILTPPW